jgi:hypothetical protein
LVFRAVEGVVFEQNSGLHQVGMQAPVRAFIDMADDQA